ncbi:MAG: hypothetical protein QOD99_2186 [Chthoniobacter sp.]|nr:hypothetical protein [Chthoniobacter sp.]
MLELTNPHTFFIQSRARRKSWRILLFLLAGYVSGMTTFMRADTVVFNDTFGGGSTINNATPSPTPAINKTAYQQISAKAFQTTSVASGHMKYGLPATTSAVNMIEALFTQYPVVLTGSNDSIQTTFTFTPQAAMLDATGGGLFFGVYNAAQIQPVPGGLNGTVGTGTAGSAQNWQGYANRIMIGSGVTTGIFTRPAQTAAGANNQDVCYSYASGVTLNSIANPIISLSASTQYTGVFTVTKTSDTALTITSNLYQGGDASGVQLFTETGTATGIVSGTFDALALGFRATGTTGGTHIQIMDVNNVEVTTTASTTVVPVITLQPASQTRQVGDNITLTVTASGGGAALTYQWLKEGNPISTATNSSATSQSLAINNAQTSDSGSYTVVVTDAAGSTTSDPAQVTVTSGAVAPSILQQPSSTTILVGGSATFTAQFAGTAPVTAQWQKSTNNGGSYSNVASSSTTSPTSYSVINAQLSDAGLYRLVATNDQGSASSSAATLTVNEKPFITGTGQPAGATLNPGQNYTLSVSGGGTPAPTYQWYRNGAAIAGATSASLALTNVSGAHTGNYTVTLTNSFGNVTSSTASIAVLSTTLNATAFKPNSTTGVNPDAPLSITFNQPVSPGVSGFIKIFELSGTTSTLVDSVDMVAATNLMNTLRASGTISTFSLPVQNQSIGTVSNFNYYPVVTNFTTVTSGSGGAIPSTTPFIYLRNNSLTYGKTYYVTVDPGVFVESTGGSFAGVTGTNTWAFTTKTSAPSAGATTLTVAADGTGDFNTVQGALDFIPAGNSTPRTIYVRKGTYFEIVYFTGKNSLTFQGEDRKQTILVYPNNNTFNNVSGLYHRMTFYGNGVANTLATNLSIKNSTPQNGGQAEAMLWSGSVTTAHNMVIGVDLYGFQDTWQSSGQVYVQDTYIEGDVDFMWGGGPAFFKNCTFKMMRSIGGLFTQIRNGDPATTNHGFVYLNCTLTAIAGASEQFLTRIDPAGFPYSEVVWLNCTMGNFLNSTVAVSGADYNAGWWKLNNANASTLAPNLHFWDYNTRDPNGNAMDFSPRPVYTRKLTSPADDTIINNYSNPAYVLGGGWTPQLAPLIGTQPVSQTVNPGQSATFTVVANGVPDPSYQWYKNGGAISGATSSSFTIASAAGVNYGSYTVTVTNTVGSVTSAPATLSFNDPEANFAASYGLDPATSGAPAADPDLDGVNNKFEFFLGGNPTRADNASMLPVSHYLTGAAPGLVFEFNRSKAAASMSYTVEYSTDLRTWTTAADGVNGVTVAITPVDANLDHVKVIVPAASSPRVFAKLRL